MRAGQTWGGPEGQRRSFVVLNPETADLEAGVGRDGCCNPLGAAWLHALWAAGTRSCWRERVASEPRGCGHPEQAGCFWRAVSAPAGASAPGASSGLSRPPGSPPAPEAAAVSPERSHGKGQVGRRVGAEAAANPALLLPTTVAHLCRDKDVQGFSKRGK